MGGGEGRGAWDGGAREEGDGREWKVKLERLKKEVGLELDRWDYALDAGRSWAVLGSGFVCLATLMGLLTGFGIFVQRLGEALETTTTAASLAGGLCTGLLSASVLPGTALYNVAGSRASLWLGAWTGTLGLVSAAYAASVGPLMGALGTVGLGFGLCLSSVVAAQTEYFLRFRRLALGLVFTGAAFGSLAAPRLFIWAVPRLGWRSALLVYAGLTSLLGLAGALTRSRRPKNFRLRVGDLVHCRLWFRLDFALLVGHGVGWGASCDVFFLLLNEVLEAAGLTERDAVWVLLAFGLANASARVASSFLAQQPWLPLLPYYAGTAGVWATALGLFAFPRALPVFVALAAIFGLGFGAMFAIATSVQLKLFGPALLPSAFGMSCFFVGLGKMASSSLAGWIVERRGTKAALGYLCAVGLVSAVLAAVLAVRDWQRDAVGLQPSVSATSEGSHPLPSAASVYLPPSARHPSLPRPPRPPPSPVSSLQAHLPKTHGSPGSWQLESLALPFSLPYMEAQLREMEGTTGEEPRDLLWAFSDQTPGETKSTPSTAASDATGGSSSGGALDATTPAHSSVPSAPTLPWTWDASTLPHSLPLSSLSQQPSQASSNLPSTLSRPSSLSQSSPYPSDSSTLSTSLHRLVSHSSDSAGPN